MSSNALLVHDFKSGSRLLQFCKQLIKGEYGVNHIRGTYWNNGFTKEIHGKLRPISTRGLAPPPHHQNQYKCVDRSFEMYKIRLLIWQINIFLSNLCKTSEKA